LYFKKIDRMDGDCTVEEFDQQARSERRQKESSLAEIGLGFQDIG
jgi:hypothetical protein